MPRHLRLHNKTQLANQPPWPSVQDSKFFYSTSSSRLAIIILACMADLLPFYLPHMQSGIKSDSVFELEWAFKECLNLFLHTSSVKIATMTFE